LCLLLFLLIPGHVQVALSSRQTQSVPFGHSILPPTGVDRMFRFAQVYLAAVPFFPMIPFRNLFDCFLPPGLAPGRFFFIVAGVADATTTSENHTRSLVPLFLLFGSISLVPEAFVVDLTEFPWSFRGSRFSHYPSPTQPWGLSFGMH